MPLSQSGGKKKYETLISLPLSGKDAEEVIERVREIAYPQLSITFEAKDLYELRTRVEELESMLYEFYGNTFSIPRPVEV